MKSVRKTVIVPHSAERMYQLVDSIEDYPRFLPWCGGASTAERTPDAVIAEIHIAYRGLRQSFVTRNANRPHERIEMRFVRGPFRSLVGHWTFRQLGDAGSRIDFALDYEFASGMLEKLVGPVFTSIADSFVDAFVRRADALYTAG
jgi:ribosome-associated toxin RatA of RatAB toxin-antitoxin module